MKAANYLSKAFFMLVGVVVFLGVGSPAQAQTASYMNIPEMQRLSNEARELWWNSLSDRQKYLIRAIGKLEEAHFTRTGYNIDPNQQNLALVMRVIGGSYSEINFVWQRLLYYKRISEALQQANRSAAQTEKVL